ncbi:universal stress protein [Streptomyces sp. A7024]|uniref:Universal stress protein n=1 Tax=Streptomyces coryli TaxID=1128680 RepID=A0A6G4TTP9_9ACTN|nr:universal stress protein [Streptomyces coryli]NGN62478.1 universal stress protein [Streptomyces coryli]
MLRPVVAGIDGSRESLAAADWAAREAQRRGTPLSVIHSWEWPPRGVPNFDDSDTQRFRAERILRNAEQELRKRYPELAIEARMTPDPPVPGLLDIAEDAELLVLGSRGLSGFAGFLVGSVGLATVSRATCPVVLVRAEERRADEHLPDAEGRPSTATPHSKVVLGIDVTHPCEEILEFAFDAAARRSAPLQAVHVWRAPLPYAAVDAGPETLAEAERALTVALHPWQEKFPGVQVFEDAVTGGTGSRLLEVASGASLLVVGRRLHRPAFAPRLGVVTHAVLHHALCPVAVVPHA